MQPISFLQWGYVFRVQTNRLGASLLDAALLLFVVVVVLLIVSVVVILPAPPFAPRLVFTAPLSGTFTGGGDLSSSPLLSRFLLPGSVPGIAAVLGAAVLGAAVLGAAVVVSFDADSREPKVIARSVSKRRFKMGKSVGVAAYTRGENTCMKHDDVGMMCEYVCTRGRDEDRNAQAAAKSSSSLGGEMREKR